MPRHLLFVVVAADFISALGRWKGLELLHGQLLDIKQCAHVLVSVFMPEGGNQADMYNSTCSVNSRGASAYSFFGPQDINIITTDHCVHVKFETSHFI